VDGVDLGDVLANAVRAERSRRRWTQEELAERLGWSKTMIQKVEAGNRALQVADIPVICRVFGLTLARLLQDADPDDLRVMGL